MKWGKVRGGYEIREQDVGTGLYHDFTARVERRGNRWIGYVWGDRGGCIYALTHIAAMAAIDLVRKR